MAKDRMVQLLELAADTMEDGGDPFSGHFLDVAWPVWS